MHAVLSILVYMFLQCGISTFSDSLPPCAVNKICDLCSGKDKRYILPRPAAVLLWMRLTIESLAVHVWKANSGESPNSADILWSSCLKNGLRLDWAHIRRESGLKVQINDS